MLGGVCGGFAEYFDVDPTLIRLAAAALALAWGTGILAYLIFWFAMPQRPIEMDPQDNAAKLESPESDKAEKEEAETGNAALFFGIALVVIGFLVLLGNFISFAWRSLWKLWPLILIIIGIVVILKGSGSKREN
jgi:phage shock protein PspC (stress-responsive transcriptional regulator)